MRVFGRLKQSVNSKIIEEKYLNLMYLRSKNNISKILDDKNLMNAHLIKNYFIISKLNSTSIVEILIKMINCGGIDEYVLRYYLIITLHYNYYKFFKKSYHE